MDEQHHEELIKAIVKQLKPVLDRSPQGIYVYLDDAHKACNKKFADLLGYASAQAWAKEEAPLADVVEEDQPAVVAAYRNASDNLIAGKLKVRVKNIKDKTILNTDMIMVPVAQNRHVFVMHFLSKV